MSVKKKHEEKSGSGSSANDGDDNNPFIEKESLILLHCKWGDNMSLRITEYFAHLLSITTISMCVCQWIKAYLDQRKCQSEVFSQNDEGKGGAPMTKIN